MTRVGDEDSRLMSVTLKRAQQWHELTQGCARQLVPKHERHVDVGEVRVLEGCLVEVQQLAWLLYPRPVTCPHEAHAIAHLCLAPSAGRGMTPLTLASRDNIV